MLLVNWHCTDIFGILTHQREEVFVQVPSCLSFYERILLLLVPTPISFANHSSLGLLMERRSLLILIAVAEHCIYAFISFLASGFLARS